MSESPELDPGALKGLLNDVSTPQELRQLLDAPGVDDNLINQFITEVGTDTVLDRIFTLMGTRFLPDKAGNASGVLQWNLDTAEGQKIYHVIIGGGKSESIKGPADNPKTTLSLSLPNLLRLAAGKLHGVTAVMTGKIKISGDMMFAASMQSWYDYGGS